MRLYQAGDIVLYVPHGVCEIVEISEQALAGAPARYYLLRPVDDARIALYVPTESEVLGARMRPVLSPAEIRALIHAMPEEAASGAEDARAALTSTDPRTLIRLIKALYARRQARASSGKQPFAADAHAMEEAERLLYEEFAYSLGIPRGEVLGYIHQELEKSGL